MLQQRPRITSLHSYRATSEILGLIERFAQPGLILHWWLGTEKETWRAVELGCYFSVNRSSVRRRDLLAGIPLERVLPETDHPFGNRGRGLQRPGEVCHVEMALAEAHGLGRMELRRRTWRTLASIAEKSGIGPLLPARVRGQLAGNGTECGVGKRTRQRRRLRATRVVGGQSGGASEAKQSRGWWAEGLVSKGGGRERRGWEAPLALTVLRRLGWVPAANEQRVRAVQARFKGESTNFDAQVRRGLEFAFHSPSRTTSGGCSPVPRTARITCATTSRSSAPAYGR